MDGDTTCELIDTVIPLVWTGNFTLGYWTSGVIPFFAGTTEIRLYKCNDARFTPPSNVFFLSHPMSGVCPDGFAVMTTVSCSPLQLEVVSSGTYAGGQVACPCHTNFSPPPTMGASYSWTWTVTE